jgi:hypothetical protein
MSEWKECYLCGNLIVRVASTSGRIHAWRRVNAKPWEPAYVCPKSTNEGQPYHVTRPKGGPHAQTD